MAEKDMEKVSLRDQSLKLEDINHERLASQIMAQHKSAEDDREDYMASRERWLESWRDMEPQDIYGPWDSTSRFNIPYIFWMGKATHARLFRIFDNEMSFFGVRARLEVYQQKEQAVASFMNWVLNKKINDGRGARDVFDKWLNDVVFEGSGIMKLFWDRRVSTYIDVQRITEEQEEIVFDEENLTGRTRITNKVREEEVEKTDVVEFPRLERVMIDDLFMPAGHSDPQTAPWVIHEVHMTDEMLKQRVLDGKFDKDAVEEVIASRTTKYASGQRGPDYQRLAGDIEGIDTEGGVDDIIGDISESHIILERYGKAYVGGKASDDDRNDLDKFPREIVTWIHKMTGKALGWTYLHRISPSGLRPFFKADFVPSTVRPYGIGIAEMLYPIQLEMRSIHNIRMDNGILASQPWGLYRSSASALKPETLRIQPGSLFPTDDPNSDIKLLNFPFLTNFGQQEEQVLNGYGEKVVSIGDLQLSQGKGLSGPLRTGTGAQLVAQESNRQLQVHFDRLARALDPMLQSLFQLSRERISDEEFFRVTGETGEPVFGVVDRQTLRGNFDFDIQADVFGEGDSEGQQKAIMLQQMLLNPAFLQTGVVSPSNLYNMLLNLLKKHNIKRPFNFITEPPNYTGDVMTTSDRIMRIITGFLDDITESVRLEENHEKALRELEAFKNSDNFGLLTTPGQLKAFNSLTEKHQQLLIAQQAGGPPNISGMQTPQTSFGALEGAGVGGAVDGGALGTQGGQARGPVV